MLNGLEVEGRTGTGGSARRRQQQPKQDTGSSRQMLDLDGRQGFYRKLRGGERWWKEGSQFAVQFSSYGNWVEGSLEFQNAGWQRHAATARVAPGLATPSSAL